MSNIFVDTSGWGNLVDISQPYHQLAVNFYQKTTTFFRNRIST